MSPSLYLATLERESRGSRRRLLFFVTCLAVGVAAVVAVAGLATSLDRGIRTEARQLLAADLVIKGRRPPPPELDAPLDRIGARRADVREMVTMAAAPSQLPDPSTPGTSQLVELKVVEDGYPFYGELLLEPDRPLAELLSPDGAVVAPGLLARLRLEVGDTLRIGGVDFAIVGTVLDEPDRVEVGLTFGPRVFLSSEGLARTALEGKGSRIDYRTLVQLPPGFDPEATAALVAELRRALPSAYRVETYREAQPALRNGLARVERFLGLVALLSLLIGGIGVAESIRAWIAGRLDSIAILKCLGLTHREIVVLYLGQATLLGLVGSLAGIALGIAIQLAVPALLPDLIPDRLIDPWQAPAMVRGLLLGVGVALLFSAPPLAAVWKISPARVLRRDAQPLPGSRWVQLGTLTALAGGIFAMASTQSGSPLLGAQFLGGVAAAAAALTVAALALTWLAARLPRGLARLWLRHGIAALARPGASTLGAIVALGLGVLVVLAMALVERQLADQLTAQLPAETPAAFLIDIQPDQWPEVERLLIEQEVEGIQSVPVVMARLTTVDQRDVEALARASRGNRSRRWALTREQRLTYTEVLPADNVIVAGALWSEPDLPEVSVEEEFARDLGVAVGSRLRFDIQGVPLELAVTSLRQVDWGTFDINFFLVVEPGVLEEAPQQRLATVRLSQGGEQRLQDLLAARFPNVTFLPIREILERIAGVIDKLGFGVRFLGGFTVIAGIAILAGAVSATSARRGHEVALLKALGVTRGGVIRRFAVEYTLLGLAAGIIGAAGGGVLAWVVLTRGMEIPWTFHAAPFAVAIAGTVVLTVAAGIAASGRALAQRPIELLRSE